MSDEIILTDADFDEKTKTGNWMVDFWAAWCGPCQAIAPTIEELATEYKGKVNIGKLDTETNQEKPTAFGVRGIPTLIFFKDGKEVDRITGVVPKETLTDKLDSVFA